LAAFRGIFFISKHIISVLWQKAPLPSFLAAFAFNWFESKMEKGREETGDQFPFGTGGISAAERCCKARMRLFRVTRGTA